VGYQYIQISFIFDLIQSHAGNHSANLALHLLLGVQALSLPIPKATSQAAKKPSFESYYLFINIFASLGKGFLVDMQFLIMVPRYIV
jgi:hypothetical protein